MRQSEHEIKNALEKMLSLYGIRLEDAPVGDEEERDFSDVISKTQQKIDTLNQKAEEIFSKTNMSREELEKYASNPNNFTKEQWEALQRIKDACEMYKREARHTLETIEKKAPTATSVKKKQPQKFAKKKKWLQM